MDSAWGYQFVPQSSPTAEECDRIRRNLACVQDPCCRTCPPFEEHKQPAAGVPTGSGETVAETLNWKKPNCVNACDSVPRECVAISACPPPPPKLVIGQCPYLSQMGAPGANYQQRPSQGHFPVRREEALLQYAGGTVRGPGTMANVVLIPVAPASNIMRPTAPAPPLPKLTPVSIPAKTEVAPAGRTKDDCVSKTAKNCGDDCPECPIEIHERTVYPKCEAMVPGYGGHVPGITTCKFGKTFGRETREALQKVYSTPRLKPYPKKC